MATEARVSVESVSWDIGLTVRDLQWKSERERQREGCEVEIRSAWDFESRLSLRCESRDLIAYTWAERTHFRLFCIRYAFLVLPCVRILTVILFRFLVGLDMSYKKIWKRWKLQLSNITVSFNLKWLMIWFTF